MAKTAAKGRAERAKADICGQVTVRLDPALRDEIDAIAASRCVGGALVTRQSLCASWIDRGVKEAKRLRDR